jgi:hypothetical protein
MEGADMMRQQWLIFVPMALATAGLAACASVLGGPDVKIRPVDTALTTAPRDALYESAVAAINERDYGRALDYLQAAKAKDPRNVKALNALGVVYDKLGRFDLSARYYTQARAIEPDSKIVAENQGYSRVLQRLLNPNQSVAAASIDLPADLNPVPVAGAVPPAPLAAEKTVLAEAVTPVTEKKVIETPRPAMTVAPLQLPDTRPLFASAILPEPVVPVVERKLIDTPPPTMMAMPLVLPDAKHVFASVSLPEPVMTVAERKLIDTPPPTMMATPLVLPDAKHVFASVSLPEPVMTVAERKLIDTPPPTMRTMPLVLPDAKHVFASVSLPEPVMTVTEKKLVDAPPPAVRAMPLTLPDTRPLFATALSPAVMTWTAPAAMMAALPAARPAAQPLIVPVATHALVPAAEPLVQRKMIAAPVAPAAAIPAPAKPVVVASTPSVLVAEKKRAAPHIPAVAASLPPVKPAMPVQVAKPVAPKPVAIAAIMPPAKLRPAVPAPAVKKQLASAAPKGKLLTIGQPIKLLNASGKPGGTGTVLRRLTSLGWTMRPGDSRAQPATVLFYPVQNLAAAKAMQRTLPFPVRLVADSGKAAGMRLVIGRDYLSWKPKNSHMATLWQKRMVVASAQKMSLRGVR